MAAVPAIAEHASPAAAAVGEALLVRAVAERADMMTDIRTSVYAALYEQFTRDAAMAVDVAEMLLDGVEAEGAPLLGVSA
jgi:hypothetical protein